MDDAGTEPEAAEEWFDVVDQDDRVVRAAPRSEVHGKGLLHRCAHIWIFNSQQELLIHLRAAGKEEEPLKWTSSAAGHLSAGESYESAAQRELQEELGLQAELTYLHKIPSGPEIGYEHTALFVGISDDVPTPDPDEILRYEYRSAEQIQAWLTETPGQFTNPFRLLWQWYVANAAN